MDLSIKAPMMKRSRNSRKSRNVRRKIMPMRTRNIKRSNIATLVHTFKRKCANTWIVGSGLLAPYLSTFPIDGISQLINGTEFTALYDQYMITGLEISFTLVIDPGAQAGNTSVFPRIFWARDQDDSTVPSDLNELRQYGNCKVAVLKPGEAVTMYCKPNVLAEIYRTGVSSTYNPVFDQWIDTSSGADARHYAFKVGIDNLTNTNYRVEIERTLYFKCRNTR